MMKSFSIGRLHISLPIIQGGMGVGISLSGLASSVANEGGVGVISCAGLGLLYNEPENNYFQNCIEGLKIELHKARAKSKGVIGVNIMVALSNYADMMRTCIAEKVDVIFSGAGLPLNMPSFLEKDSTTCLVPIVSSARALKLICEKWERNYNYLPDAIVVEGPKAGGHLGFKLNQIDSDDFTLEKIIPEVVAVTESYASKKKIPIVAGGGLMTGADIKRIMDLGADGVQLASIFVPTLECDAAENFKQAYIHRDKSDVMIINSPVGMPGRAFDGEFLEKVKKGLMKPKVCAYNCIKTCDYKNSPYCIIKVLYNAAKGNLDKGFVFCGANAYQAENIRSVSEVITRLKSEYESCKN
jgi:NAD(P)H-dependent flavin oxidoreductase YrpB (nitropropane dioxygenase family)